MERFNCITCSKECDYKLKNKVKIKKNGINYFNEWREKINDRIVVNESPNCIGFWLKKGYTEEFARTKVVQYNRSVSPLCEEYYPKYLGITDKSIVDYLISSEQKKRSKRSIEYWMSRGKTKNESLKLVSSYQDNTSLLVFVKRYGEELGTQKYNEYVHKIKSSTVFDINVLIDSGLSKDEAIKKIADIQISAGNGRHSSGRYSIFEASLEPILELLNVECIRKKVVKIDDRYDGRNRNYIELDYFLPDLNFNIEMDGSHWHSLEGQVEEDEARDCFLNLLEINVIRVDEYLWNSMKKHEKVNYIKEKICVSVK